MRRLLSASALLFTGSLGGCGGTSGAAARPEGIPAPAPAHDDRGAQRPPSPPAAAAPSDASTPGVDPKIVAGRLVIDPTRAPHKAELPRALAVPGADYWAMVKVCVDKAGEVERATIVKSAHAELDARILAAIETWRYAPYSVNGEPVAFCYVLRYVMRAVSDGPEVRK